MDAREFRHALGAVAHHLNQQVQDWTQLSEEQHLAIATDALDAGDLAAACASLLCALEQHERERLATRDEVFAADELRRRMDARRAR
jgi:hypothetical protein